MKRYPFEQQEPSMPIVTTVLDSDAPAPQPRSSRQEMMEAVRADLPRPAPLDPLEPLSPPEPSPVNPLEPLQRRISTAPAFPRMDTGGSGTPEALEQPISLARKALDPMPSLEREAPIVQDLARMNVKETGLSAMLDKLEPPIGAGVSGIGAPTIVPAPNVEPLERNAPSFTAPPALKSLGQLKPDPVAQMSPLERQDSVAPEMEQMAMTAVESLPPRKPLEPRAASEPPSLSSLPSRPVSPVVADPQRTQALQQADSQPLEPLERRQPSATPSVDVDALMARISQRPEKSLLSLSGSVALLSEEY